MLLPPCGFKTSHQQCLCQGAAAISNGLQHGMELSPAPPFLLASLLEPFPSLPNLLQPSPNLMHSLRTLNPLASLRRLYSSARGASWLPSRLQPSIVETDKATLMPSDTDAVLLEVQSFLTANPRSALYLGVLQLSFFVLRHPSHVALDFLTLHCASPLHRMEDELLSCTWVHISPVP